MNIHKNARLTPLGRERVVREVLSGQTPESAARAAGVCPRTVRKWVARFEAATRLPATASRIAGVIATPTGVFWGGSSGTTRWQKGPATSRSSHSHTASVLSDSESGAARLCPAHVRYTALTTSRPDPPPACWFCPARFAQSTRIA